MTDEQHAMSMRPVLCKECLGESEYIRTRQFETQFSHVWMCQNEKCKSNGLYFHTDHRQEELSKTMTNANEPIHAFARAASDQNGDQTGMTLRAWLAGIAMQGLITSDHEGSIPLDKLVAMSVEHADALLKELEK